MTDPTHGRLAVADSACCLHPDCSPQDCPEPVCYSDFKGGRRAFDSYKRALEIKRLNDEGLDYSEIATQLSVSLTQVRRSLRNNGVNSALRH